MTNDAKLGLLAGVAAVLVSAVVYYQKPDVVGVPVGKAAVPGTSAAPPQVTPAAVVVPGGTPPKAAIRPGTDPLTRDPDR